MMRSALVAWLLSVLSSIPLAMAQNTTDESYSSDPILQYRPPFAQSLPVQILLIGIVLTLVVVLFIHLIFTAQYHWPLARTNYILQLTGVTTLLITLIASLYVVFISTVQESQHWPYMLSYVAVDMPRYIDSSTLNSTDPTIVYQHKWTVAESATWIVMNATTAAVIQITHIHFLTLLYPSNLEARLIFSLLGPLAIIAAVMQLLPIFCGSSVLSIASDTRNVCNAALSLLFTSALIIWGFFVNRPQAWRTDGGTAAFGAGAILLAVISSTLNFLYIHRQDQYAWMPKLMWAVVLWQSFLGWWWWVGAGMGIREVEELLAKENKRQEKRRLRAERRKEQKERAKSVWKGFRGALKPNGRPDDGGGSQERTGGVSRSQSRDAAGPPSTVATSTNVGFMQPFHLVQRWYARLRHAHLTAAHIQAVERVERIHQVYGREEVRNSMREPGAQVVGWGLGSYGLREAERERREELGFGTSDEEVEDDENVQKSSPDESLRTHLRYRGVDQPRDASPQPSAQASAPALAPTTNDLPRQEEEVGWSSMWWWGPLRRWRLQDSTSYR